MTLAITISIVFAYLFASFVVALKNFDYLLNGKPKLGFINTIFIGPGMLLMMASFWMMDKLFGHLRMQAK